jgi:hypothetical protein
MGDDEDLSKTRKVLVMAQLFAAIVILGRLTRDLNEQDRIGDCKRILRRSLCATEDNGTIRVRGEAGSLEPDLRSDVKTRQPGGRWLPRRWMITAASAA